MSLKIDLDIAAECLKFNLDPALIQAVRNAEGGTRAALLKAVRCSIPNCRDEDEAVHITCRSAVHALCDFARTVTIGTSDAHGELRGEVDLDSEFVHFWALRWAPPGAANDPKNLNANWAKNVLAIWRLK